MADQPGRSIWANGGGLGDSGVADEAVEPNNCSTEVSTSRSRSADSVTSESLRSPTHLRCDLGGLAVLAWCNILLVDSSDGHATAGTGPNIDPDRTVPDDPGELLPDAPDPCRPRRSNRHLTIPAVTLVVCRSPPDAHRSIDRSIDWRISERAQRSLTGVTADLPRRRRRPPGTTAGPPRPRRTRPAARRP